MTEMYYIYVTTATKYTLSIYNIALSIYNILSYAIYIILSWLKLHSGSKLHLLDSLLFNKKLLHESCVHLSFENTKLSNIIVSFIAYLFISMFRSIAVLSQILQTIS